MCKFKENGSIEYGIVQYYLFVRNILFVVIFKYVKKGNVCFFNFGEQVDLMIKLFMDRDIFGKQVVRESFLKGI